MNRPEFLPPPQAADEAGDARRNQAWLTQRFAFWRDRLDASSALPEAVAPIAVDEGFIPASEHLAQVFGLSPFETELVVLAAGLELDAGLRIAVARAQGADPARSMALPYALALSLLPAPHWDAISPSAPLRRWGLVEIDAAAGLAQARLRVNERVLHFLTGVAAHDPRLAGVAQVQEPAPVADDSPARRVADQIQARLAEGSAPRVLFTSPHHDVAGRRSARALAGQALRHAGLQALWVDAAALPGDAFEFDTLVRRIEREALLQQAGVVIAPEADVVPGSPALRLLAALGVPVIVLGRVTPLALADLDTRALLRFSVTPDRAAAAARHGPAVQRSVARALQQFRVEPAVLDEVLDGLDASADEAAIERTVWSALREAARDGLDALAQRLPCRAGFEDLAVPAFVATQLREITGQLKHRAKVHDEWGFAAHDARGLGLSALFVGDSGTGKTLAAEVIAHETGLDLYRVDLSATVSKYIGETEKNLSRLFDAAERSGAVLLFDEADALFGQRSEVRDSHDRYANIEVAYLLQRIESYRGLAILTTNMKSALDRALLRRLRFVVQFPFPDAAMRAQIWQKVLPAAAPTQGLDFGRLGRLPLSGGSIRNIALNAAFGAAARGGVIDADRIAEAAQAEMAKLERNWSGAGERSAMKEVA